MPGRQGFITNHQTYVYQESPAGTSTSFGIDMSDSGKWKVFTSLSMGALPGASAQLTIDPAANGNITLTPNGNGSLIVSPLTNGAVLSSATGILSSAGPGTAGWVLTSNGAALAPTFQANAGGGIGTINADVGSTSGPTVTIAGGANVTTAIVGTTLTITAAGSGGIVWTSPTTTPITLASNHGYVQAIAGAGQMTFTLPAAAAVGDIVQIIGQGSGGWTIVHPIAGHYIQFGNLATTSNTGSLSSSDRYDCVTLTCRVIDTIWAVTSSIGNLIIT